MAISELKNQNEESSYSGLGSFDNSAYEKELALCAEVGADVAKLKAMKFNPLQLSEIRKGIVDKVDVSKYMDPKLSWSAMEEMRLEMYQKIDMSGYRAQGFDPMQLSQIRQGIFNEIDVSQYAKKEYFADQMREIRVGLSSDPPVPVIFYLDPSFDSLQMREIRKGLQAGIDIGCYAHTTIPYLKMRAIRESAEDGLVFNDLDIQRYNAAILKQIHKAYIDKVDISPYVKDRFDEEQLEEVRMALKAGIPIDSYISGEMRGDAIREIRLGLESGVDVSQYADASYNWQQMYEMRIGLENQIDITPYKKQLYQADQMREIRLGIEAGLDISKYATLMYTAKDMRRIREKLLEGVFDKDANLKAVYEKRYSKAELTDDDILMQEILLRADEFIDVTADKMMCYLRLPRRSDGKQYTEEFIKKFLQKNRIIFGYNEDEIKKICEKFDPDENYLVAVGKEAVNGVDGYYEYFFDTEPKQEPKILKDGTADLTDLQCLQQIKVGDKLALYHRATRGVDGYDVYGRFNKAVTGKETPILKGNGFMILSDRVTYVATLSGAIRMVNGMVEVKKLMVVQEVKITDKKIKYDGDVYVVGNVNSGSVIEATGDVIIGGHMESSDITSGGNVVIKGGVTCPIRGGINAKGSIVAKYYEGATLSGTDISGNYFINCKVDSSGFIRTFGRVGLIYGGTLSALYGLETASIGNKTGARTIINLGCNAAILAKHNNLIKAISREKDQLDVLNTEKERLKEAGAGNREIMQWKVKINAAVASKGIRIKEIEAELVALDEEIKKGKGAKAVVTECAYANTVFVISGAVYRVEEDRRTYDSLTFKSDANNDNVVVI